MTVDFCLRAFGIRTIPRTVVLVVAAAAIMGGLLCGLAGWPPSIRAAEFAALMLVTLLHSAVEDQRESAGDSAIMPPSFVIDFAALLLLGPIPAALVATVGAITHGCGDARYDRLALTVATVTVATLTAGFVLAGFAAVEAGVVWPWRAVPLAVSVTVYCLVRGLSAEFLVPHVAPRPIRQSWLEHVRYDASSYIVGASVAVLVVEAIDQRLWGPLVLAAVPLFFLSRSSGRRLEGVDDEHQRLSLIESIEEGVCVIDANGEVKLWNDALQRILSCSRKHVLGRSIDGAVPALADTRLLKAIEEAVAAQSPQTLSHLMLPCQGGHTVFRVKILPDGECVTLLWHDVTDRWLAEQALKRSEDRFSLLETGINDGLWEWDLRNDHIRTSARWQAMLGLTSEDRCVRSEDWFSHVHPEDAGGLRNAIAAHVAGRTEALHHEHRMRHRDGTYRYFLCRGVAVRGTGRRPIRIGGSLTDVTDRAKAQESLRNSGSRDPLTGLCNRTIFVEVLGRRLQDLKEQRGSRFAALYLDLDRFKVVNDSLGHLVGDLLLTAVSRRLESCLREGDALARLGGDEFAILLNGLDDEGQANAIAFRIQEALSAPFSLGGKEVFTSVSIGIAFSAVQYDNPEEIMRDADTAMYHAKARGKARHELFDADMHAQALDRLGLENDLRHAVKSRDFEVHYQPIVSLASGACAGFEALVRWRRNGQIVSPEKFIPVAEELGLIEAIGTWVLCEACRTFAGWQRRFPESGLECITVNVSTRQLMQQNFLRIVEQALHEANLQPSALRLEITETTLMDSPQMAAVALKELRDFGVKIYLDDFGTGYSSLSHLHKLPVDALKIDRSFVRSLLLPDRPAIVESILALARTLETGVVAEGVENDVQACELERLGCRHAQGFFFSPAIPGEAVEQLLQNSATLGRAWHERSATAATTRPTLAAGASQRFEWPDAMPVGVAASGSLTRSTSSVEDAVRVPANPTAMWAIQ